MEVLVETRVMGWILFAVILDHNVRAVNAYHCVLSSAIVDMSEPDPFFYCQDLDRKYPAVVTVQGTAHKVVGAKAVRLLSCYVHERDPFRSTWVFVWVSA